MDTQGKAVQSMAVCCLSRSLVPAWGIIRLAEESFPSLERKEELGTQRYNIYYFIIFISVRAFQS
jgi:hypothetical protein